MDVLTWLAVASLIGAVPPEDTPPEPASTPRPAFAPGLAPDSLPRAQTPPSAGAGLRSLLLPGWGQRRQDRSVWWLFPLVEVAGWGGWLQGRAEGDRFRGRYRELAWDRARAPVWSGPREDGPWEYYERMLQWRASGRFDLAPEREELVPETDPATFNGSVWNLARAIHLPGGGEADPDDPAFHRALDYYRNRAVPAELAWDWGDDDSSREAFRGLVKESDEAFRRATGFLGLVLVNHFASAVEAWAYENPGPLAPLPFRLTGRALPGARPGEWGIRIDLSRNPNRRIR